METTQVSAHEIRVFEYIKESSGWVTNKEIAEHANVSERTARQKTKKLVELGLLNVESTFPGYRYQLSEFARNRNHAYVIRLYKAKEALGLK